MYPILNPGIIPRTIKLPRIGQARTGLKISPSGMKGLAAGLAISLLFVELSWLEVVFCLGLGVAGFFLGLLHDRLPVSNGD